MKISVILPTNKKNSYKELQKLQKIRHVTEDKLTINREFTRCCNKSLNECEHILEPTLISLVSQTFSDFEVLLCHKYPDDVKGLMSSHDDYEDIKLIKEKPSIWHELGDYPTVNNNRNTGIIHAKGELLVFLDDMTMFNRHLLQDIWNEYKKGYYTTSRGHRRIRYAPDMKVSSIKPNRGSILDNGIYSSRNFNMMKQGNIIPISSTWTYCCSVSLEDTLKINGFDEIYDGNFGGTDQDFGNRLAQVSNKSRKLLGNIYEFAHKSTRQKTRDDELLRQVFGQSPIPNHIIANSWKPTKREFNRYKSWHNKRYSNDVWDKFMDVPMYNIGDLR